MEPLNVIMANGSKLKISSIVKNFSWTVLQTTFTYLLFPLGCCDLVLGIGWLIMSGNITWNFELWSSKVRETCVESSNIT